MQKRGWLAMLLVLSVVLSLCVLPAHAANDTAKLILTPIEAMPNEQFKTTLCVAEGSEIVDFQIQLLYDTDVVRLVSAKASDDVDGDVVVNSGQQGVLKINYTLTSENTSEQMPVVDLVFATDEEIGVGGYEFLKENTAAAKSADRMVGTDLISVPLECDFSALNIYGSGDVDLNGNVEIRDVTRLRQYLARLVTLTDYQLRMADAYYDEDVNVRDAVYIQQKLAEFNVQLGSRANIRFYRADGTLYTTKSVVLGSDLTKVPAVPAVAGQGEGSWSLSADELTAVDFSAVSGDMNVYAFYGGSAPTPTPDDTYDITYDLYGNDNYLLKVGVTNPNPASYSSETGLTLKNPAVAGYRFVGWYDGQGSNAAQIKSIAKGTTGDLELFAHWEAIEYTINYEVGMGNIKSEGKFKVNENKTLTVPTTDLVPMMANYIFLGWSDENGNLVQTIPAGTVPDNGANSLTFRANWTSRRNMAHPLSKLGDPMIFEDTDSGQILFTYELGTLENVPLYTVQTFDAVYGMKQIVTQSVTKQITKDQSEIISKKVSDAVTDSTEMTLGLGFTEQTSAYEASAIEHGKTREEANSESRTDRNTITVNNSQGGSNSTTSSSGYSATLSGTQSHQDTSSSVREKSYEYGTASDYTANVKTYLDNTTTVKAGAEAGVSYGVGPAKASAKVYAEASNTTSAGISTDNTLNIKNYNNGSSYQKDTSSNANGWTSGNTISDSGSTTHSSIATWNTSRGYENSHEVATSSEIRQAVTELVSKQTSYGKDYIQNKTEENKQGFAQTKTTENCNTSQVTYGEKMIETIGKTYEVSGAAVGRYRVCCAGTAHIFAVVGYDVADSTYYTYSMAIMDDETHDFIDYSYDGTFTDYDNGVIPFEIPYFVNEYVSNRMAKTDGLIVDTDTGIVTGFDTDKQATFVKVPAYVSVDNMDGTNRPVAITGISSTAFRGRTDIEAVCLNDFITEIPDNAFEGCTNLKKILMPGVTEIGDNAFKGCANFEQFSAGTGVTAIGDNAFEGVKNVNVKAANADVANAVVNCGAENITLNISAISEEMAEAKIVVPDTVSSFVLQGGGKSFRNMKLKSDAATTTINQVTFSDCSGIPVEISSPDVKLQNVTVNSTGYGVLLTADKTSISLYNNSYITSSVNRAIICKGLDVQKSPEAIQNGAASQLKVSGDILICDAHTGDENVNFTESTFGFKTIDLDTYNKYAKGMYQVTFDANGGALTSGDESVNVCYGEQFNAMPEAEREHFDFDGWFTEAEGGEQVTEASVFSSTEDITLYAHWTRKTYTLTFDANGGSVDQTSKQISSGLEIGDLPTPNRPHHNFFGWYANPECEGDQITAESIATTAGDFTVYAKWELKDVTGWVKASEVPADAQVVNNKWTYTQKTTVESRNTSMSGYSRSGPRWVQSGSGSVNWADFPGGFDTGNWYYQNFHHGNPGYSSYTNETSRRDASNSWRGYIYWHWMYDVNRANGTSTRAIYNQYGYGPDNGFLYKYFGAFDSTNGNYSSDTSYCNSRGIRNWIIPERTAYDQCQGATRWFRFDWYTASYTDYYALYTFTKTEDLESTTAVSNGTTTSNGYTYTITNTQQWVQYRPV